MKKTIYEILEYIESNGYQAYLVGGYPRSHYLGKETEDYDICTNATPVELKRLFPVILEENFGSLKIKYQEVLFEITTYRIEENYTSVRTPTIHYTEELVKDLQRRDFIMNTLCMDKEGNYIDLLGAREDIDNHLIRVVGDNNQKMKEDPLRILRAIRFATKLNFTLENTLQESILQYKDRVKQLSYYRKKEELGKILNSENCSLGIQLLKEFSLDSVLECTFPIVTFVPNNRVMWAQIEYCSNYPFTKVEAREISFFKGLLKKGNIEDIGLYYYGADFLTDVAFVLGIPSSVLIQREQRLPIHHKKDIQIDVEKIPKESISSTITLLEKAIIENKVENTRESIQAFLEEYLK